MRYCVIEKNKLKATDYRVADFRSTLDEIVNYKNGIVPDDASSEEVLITPRTPMSSDIDHVSLQVSSNQPQTDQYVKLVSQKNEARNNSPFLSFENSFDNDVIKNNIATKKTIDIDLKKLK